MPFIPLTTVTAIAAPMKLYNGVSIHVSAKPNIDINATILRIIFSLPIITK